MAFQVAFEQRPPSLKLNLARNELKRLPGAIFNVEHLTMLSVARNELRDIPPAIGKLKNLCELNIATNHLNSLPYELLELIRSSTQLKTLVLYPNPFYVAGIDEAGLELQKEQRESHAKEGHGLHRFAVRSPVHYLDSMGETYSQFRLPSTSSHSPTVVEVDSFKSPAPPSSDPKQSKSRPESLIRDSSRVPTLVELALRACYDSPELEFTPDMLPPGAPAYLGQSLKAALAQKETGGWTCSVCGRPMVVPRAVWLEWWELDRDDRVFLGGGHERLVPFLRRACSWRCGPTV